MSQCYFYTRLVDCDNYPDFLRVFSQGFYQDTLDYPREGSYNISNYANTFKGFDFDTYYSFDGKTEFLSQIMPGRLLGFLDPEFDVKTKTVTFFENLDKKNRGIRSNPTKMGKFFRKVCPFFGDKQIEFLVNYTVSYLAENNYTHNVATGEEITKIYTSKVERGRYLNTYSCINASCMRHNDWDIHPTKVYATDSWELHYLTNEDGDIAARALVCKEDNVYSYIYASCEQSGDFLKEKLEELEFTDVEEVHKPFDGAKLLKIGGNGGLVAPYIDYHCNVKDCGEHLEITYGYADYSFGERWGYIELKVNYECNSCGREICEYGVICVDGETYCKSCTFFCDHFNEYVVGEPIYVFRSNFHCCSVCEDALEDMGAIYNEEENEWRTAEWHKNAQKGIRRF